MVEIFNFENISIFIRFNKKEYLKLFGIKKNLNDIEKLFAPFYINLYFKYITLDDEEKHGDITIKYFSYYENIIIPDEWSSEDFTLDPKPITMDAIEILFKNKNIPSKENFYLK